MSIFISIASYCDPVLPFTLLRAVQQARWPDALHLAVIDQSPPGQPPLDEAALAPARLSVVHIDPLQARGPCWARALAMSLYAGEDWFFQIDSHMDFDLHWDERLIDQALALQAMQSGFVISSYPNAFELQDGQPVHKAATTKVLGHVVKAGAQFAPDHPVLGFEAHPFDSDEPVRGFHVGAGCLFAPGDLVQRFPYDPYLYFHGEEQALAARLFTHGWDIFHMSGLPVFHLYRTTGSPASERPLHWDAAQDTLRKQAWWTLEQRSQARLRALLQEGQDLGVYGLGTVRSLADYADFCGVDYAARTLAPVAFRGPWRPAEV
jgi:hypothetical protein